MGHTVDKKHPCYLCGKPTRKRIDRGMRARCADCGRAVAAEVNEIQRALYDELRRQRKWGGQPSTVDAIETSGNASEAGPLDTVDGRE